MSNDIHQSKTERIMNSSVSGLCVSSNSEYGSLNSTILGTFNRDHLPLETFNISADFSAANSLLKEAYPDWYVDEVNEDIEDFRKLLIKKGVTVVRPEWPFPSSTFSNPLWTSQGYDIYNVRDNHLIVDDIVISCPSSERFRVNEHYAFHNIFNSIVDLYSVKWLYAPRPVLPEGFSLPLNVKPNELQIREDAKHRLLSLGHQESYTTLAESEPIFDAANVCRLGNDILYLVSSTANKKGFNWLSSILPSKYKIHPTMTYRSSHIDSTICPLSNGLVLMNGDRVDDRTAPSLLKTWDKIYFTDVEPIPSAEIEFFENVRLPIHKELKALGFNSRVGHISSPWGGLNVFSLNESTVFVEQSQIKLIRVLENKGLTVIPVRYRHMYTMLGCLHCSTLDLHRDPV